MSGGKRLRILLVEDNLANQLVATAYLTRAGPTVEKAGTGVENKESVGTASEFTAGTKVWIWSRITGAANTTVQHVWKKDGAKVWAANLKIKGNKWTTASRRQLKAGSYSVEVVGADGAVLGSVAFTVK